MDAVTFEVIRHRLWAINDEQGLMAARLSGSPVVYEARDFNAALTTPDGRGLITGVYILHQGPTVDYFVRRILAAWAPAGIRAGDMFFTNDPADGALHANDAIVAMPIFFDDRLVAWAGITMHDNDVGSPVPGSFVFGARDRWGEAPLFPAVKFAENYELRTDIFAAYLRNSRMPESNAVNMHARLAALLSTRNRIDDLVGHYGVETFLEAQEEMISYVHRIVSERLRAIPDGEWSAQSYHDHDTVTADLFPLRCRVVKRGASIVFDTAGTSPQAAGPINCRQFGAETAIVGVLFTYLCFDLPWSTGALRGLFTIDAEKGTLNAAFDTAPTSMATLMAIQSTQDVVADACAKMLLSEPTLRSEAQATWAPVGAGGQLIGKDLTGETFFVHLMEGHGGGGGARTFDDGVDSGGVFHSMACTMGNVETIESTSRILYLYRRQLQDGGGPGRFRGGVPVEFAVTARGVQGPVIMQTLSSSFSAPGGRGLAGGSPGAASHIVIARGSDIAERFDSGSLPQTLDELSSATVEVLPAKAQTMVSEGDIIFGSTSGGAGYGDPLRRDPQRVLHDIRMGLVSVVQARETYGVVVVEGGSEEAAHVHVDADATVGQRDALRARRLGVSADSLRARETRESSADARLLTEVVEQVGADDRLELRCTQCGEHLGNGDEDYKAAGAMREIPARAANPHNRFVSDEVVLREFSCPGCGTLLAVDVQKKREPVLPESRLYPRGAVEHS
ncbi:MAG: hydantoinase B/oxoprolinase family protein [Microbacterium sp.]|uniref:hydantoinase B/oxoprolinase family protein n=1 Tax=Microbacterium sp. TaxID=51671 RepID=UPI0039E484CE